MKNLKYKTDFFRLTAGCEKTTDALADYLTNEGFSVEREGFTVYHDKKISKARANYMRGMCYAFGLANFSQD